MECNGILGTGPNLENPTILFLPIPCLFRPPNPIFKLLSGWLKQYTTDHCEYSVACVNAFDMSLPKSCSLASQPLALSSCPCCHFSRNPNSSSSSLLQMLQEDSEEEAWTKTRDKSVALRGTWISLVTEIMFSWVY